MRDFKGMKRQRGRNRKPNNNANNANPNRSWDSQGPENIKVRGNAQTVYERYQQLARDASSAGDRVLAENYMQHAEHYFRVLRALQPQRPVSEIAARELSNQGFDIDFEDETGAQAAAFLAAQQAADRAAQGQQGQGQQGESQGGDQRPYRDRDQNQNREWRDREPREPREPRDDNAEPRADGEGGRRETRRERWERRQQERNRRFETEGQSNDSEGAPAEPQVADTPAEQPASEAPGDTPVETPRPTRARRPRAAADTSPSDDDAATSLPGFLTRAPAPAVAANEDGEAAAPRRRAPRRKIEASADSDE
jgi:hypothetical protein